MAGHPPRIKNPAFYLASLSAPACALNLLHPIAEASLRGRTFAPGHRALAQLVHRSERTVRRQLRLLTARGWVRVIRRGRCLKSIYRLSRPLWGRLTGRPERPHWRPLQYTLTGLVGALSARTHGWEVWTDGERGALCSDARGAGRA